MGTSNAVMWNGFAAGIAAHPAVTEAPNHSLGSSASVILPKILQQADFRGIDYVVLDFALNEEIWTLNGVGTVAQIEERVLDFIASLPQDGPRPAIAILPSLTSHRPDMPVRDMYRRMATEHGYPYVDGYAFLQSRRLPLALAPEGPFRDNDHMQPELGHAFGMEIAERLAAEGPVIRSDASRMLPSHDHVAVAQADLDGATLIDRATSLTAVQVARVERDQALTFRFGERVELIGVGVNGACSNADMTIESDLGSIWVRTRGGWYRPGGDGLVYMAVPCPLLAGNWFRFTIAPNQAADVTAEIGGISVRGPACERSYRAYAPAPLI